MGHKVEVSADFNETQQYTLLEAENQGDNSHPIALSPNIQSCLSWSLPIPYRGLRSGGPLQGAPCNRNAVGRMEASECSWRCKMPGCGG